MAGLGLCCSLQGLPKPRCLTTGGALSEGSFQFQSGRVYVGKQFVHRLQFVSPDSGHVHREETPGRHAKVRNRLSLVVRSAESTTNNNGSTDDKKATKARDKAARRAADIRGKISDFLEQKSGYSWLLGPLVSTAMVVIPAATMSLASIFQRNYLAGLAATFGLDILFVISTDLFLVLTNKLGHHNQVSGGPPPWIGPWEFTGYPEGFPKLLNYVSYTSVGVAALASLASFFTGKLLAAVAILGPYLALIFVQVAYERLLTTEKSPVSPLVPVVYTVYRFWQLTRGVVLMSTVNGGPVLSKSLHLSSGLWALYLAMYLTQLPWLYSTWNSNRAT